MSHVWQVSFYMVKATGSESSWGNRSCSGASVVASRMSSWAWCLELLCRPEPGNVSETFLIEVQYRGLNELHRKSFLFHLSIHYFILSFIYVLLNLVIMGNFYVSLNGLPLIASSINFLLPHWPLLYCKAKWFWAWRVTAPVQFPWGHSLAQNIFSDN